MNNFTTWYPLHLLHYKALLSVASEKTWPAIFPSNSNQDAFLTASFPHPGLFKLFCGTTSWTMGLFDDVSSCDFNAPFHPFNWLLKFGFSMYHQINRLLTPKWKLLTFNISFGSLSINQRRYLFIMMSAKLLECAYPLIAVCESLSHRSLFPPQHLHKLNNPIPSLSPSYTHTLH